MATLDINGRQVQVDDSFLSLPPDQQEATVDEIARSIGAAAPAEPEGPGIIRRMLDPREGPVGSVARTLRDTFSGLPGAAEAIVNDISAAGQGVNPTAASEALNSGQAIGELVKHPGMKPYVALYDGSTFNPLSDFPPEQFVTHQEHGTTYIIPRQAKDSAGESIEEGRLAGAGRLLGLGVPTGVPSAGRSVPAAAKPPAPKVQAARDAEALGITPSFAMGGTVQGKVAAAGEQFAPTAGPFMRDAGRVSDEMAGVAARLADRAGPGITPVEAGEALQRGGETYVQGVRDFQSTLYGQVDKAIPPETTVGTPETINFLRGEIEKLASTPNIAKSVGNKELEGWLADLEGPATAAPKAGISWQTARALRTSIGESIGKLTGPARDVSSGKLKAIYGALSKDLDAAAEAAGPAAAAAWRKANKYTRTSEERIEKTFSRILKADTPERAYSILTGMATEGTARSNIAAMRRVFKELPADERAVVAGTIIRRLGRATPGAQNAAGDAFSADTFLSNWNRMAPEAREIIGRSGLDEGVGEGLSQLARVVEQAKQSGAFRNRSNTGNVGSAVAIMGGLQVAPVSTIATVLSTGVGARVLTNRRFLHALNRYVAKNEPGALKKLAAATGEPGAIEAAAILRLAAPTAADEPRTPATAPVRGTR